MSRRSGTQQLPRKQSGQGQKQKPKQKSTNQPQPPAQAPAQRQVEAPSRPKAPAASPQLAATQEAKRQSRMERQRLAQIAAAKRRQKARIRRIGIVAAIAVLLLGGAFALIMREVTKPGERVAVMPSPHLQSPTEPHAAYNTDPPTSGPHWEEIPEWKVYTVPITDELQVHGLEDGGVIIHHKPEPELDKAIVDRLAGIATSYHEQESPNNHVVMAPDPNLSHPIVLTAWGRIDRLEAFDEARIRRFISEYVGWDHHAGREGRRVGER